MVPNRICNCLRLGQSRKLGHIDLYIGSLKELLESYNLCSSLPCGYILYTVRSYMVDIFNLLDKILHRK